MMFLLPVQNRASLELIGSVWVKGIDRRLHAAGLVLLTHPPFIFGGTMWAAQTAFGILCGLASAIFAAGAFLSIKALGGNEQPIVMTMWFHFVAAATAILPVCLKFPIPAVLPSWHEAGLLLNVVWTSFLGQLLLSRGFQLLSPSSAAAVNLTQVVHAHILSALVLHDNVRWYSFAGSSLIALGVLLAQAGRGASPSGNAPAGSGKELYDQELTCTHSDLENKGLLVSENVDGEMMGTQVPVDGESTRQE
jgi:uncharacterized membrane protein